MIRTRSRLSALGMTLFASVFGPATPSSAAWPLDGAPVIQAAGRQFQPALATDGAGGAWIAWADERVGGGECDIYARHLDVNGAPLGPAGGIAVATAPGRQEAPVLVSDGQGGCIIVWQDRRERLTGSDLFMQRLGPGGAPLWRSGGVALLVTYGNQEAPQIVRETYGSWIVVWQDGRLAGNPSLYAQRLLDNGLPSWLPSGLPVCRERDGQLSPRLIADQDGGAFVVWSDRRNGLDYDLYGQRLTLGGEARWPADGRLLAGGPGHQLAPLPVGAAPNLALDATGGFYVAWTDTRGSIPDVWLHHLAGDGQPAPGWPGGGLRAAATPLPRSDPGLVSDGAGGAIVSFRESLAAGDDRIRALRRSGDGAPAWSPDGAPVTPTIAPRTGPGIASDGHGGVFLVWSEATGGDAGNIRLQWLDAAGQPVLAAGGRPLCEAAGWQSAPAALAVAASDVSVVWSDLRSGNRDLYANRLGAGLGNLTLAAWPAGFSAPLVPRAGLDTLPDAGELPASLPGNTAVIRLNAAFQIEAQGMLPGWRARVTLDGVLLQETPYPAGWPPGAVVRLNDGPYLIRGGRHTLRFELDAGADVPESVEDDNVWSAQYVVEPRPIAAGQAERRAAPPAPGDGAEPNCDGFRWDAPSGMAWAVAVGPTGQGLEETLILYNDYSGLIDGFSSRRVAAGASGAGVTFVLGDRATPPGVFYPAIARAGPYEEGPAGTLIEAQVSGERRPDRLPFVWGPEILGPDRLLHVYEVYLAAGSDQEFVLERASGAADLEMALFATTGDIVGPGAAKVVSAPETGTTDRFRFQPASSGWYPLVVYRRFAGEAAGTDAYRLYGLAGQSAAPPPLDGRTPALRLTPNPLRRAGALDLHVPTPGPVTLDLFDIRGRHLRRLLDRTTLDPGSIRLTWNGDDAAGSRLPAGRYTLRLTAGGVTRNLPVTLLP